MKKFVLLFVLFLSSGFCFAYPITPRPLRQLVIESQYILAGNVISITELPEKSEYHSPQAIARIEIVQVLQGTITTKYIDVHFDNYMGCPAPAHYEINTTVLAFLDFADTKFTTHALSYGSKTLESADLEIYKSRITEIQKILAIKDQFVQYNETLDWLIKCAEQPATQWEGVFELSPHSDFMSSYSQRKQSDFGQFLSDQQKNRLFQIIKNKDVFDYGDFGIIDLVYAKNEAFIDERLIKSLNALDNFGLLFARDYMQRLGHLLPKKQLEKFVENQEKFLFDNSDEQKQKKNIREFIACLKK